MTKLLEDAIEKVRQLPTGKQDEAAELLLSVVEQARSGLTQEQAAEVRARQNNRKFATDEEVTAFFQQAGQ